MGGNALGDHLLEESVGARRGDGLNPPLESLPHFVYHLVVILEPKQFRVDDCVAEHN